MSTVLVTGATGYIGRYLVNHLVKSGDEVHGLTRRQEVQRGVHLVHGDLLSDLALPSGTKTIYHCAGVIDDEERMAAVNVEGTRRIVDLALRHDALLVHLSSAGVVGQPGGVVTEETVCCPRTLYEKSKHQAELVIQEGIQKGLRVQMLRPTVVFGVGRAPDKDSMLQLFRAIKRRRYRNIGEGYANLVHAHEVCRALYTLGTADLPNGGTYFINSPIQYSALARLVLGSEAKSIPYFLALTAAVPLTFLTWATGRKMPLTLSRVRALTSTTIFEQNRILTDTPYFPEKPLQSYLMETVSAYEDLGML